MTDFDQFLSSLENALGITTCRFVEFVTEKGSRESLSLSIELSQPPLDVKILSKGLK
jgi:hypothetical protein